MAAMAVLQSSMSSMSLGSFSSSSVFGSSLEHGRSQQVACGGPTTIRMAVKRWEKKKLQPNGLPVRLKLHVKVGDSVKVIAGKDKGKISEVVKVFSHNAKVLCKDVNIMTKHVKPRAEGESGQIIQIEAPIHSSNVMAYSKESKVASRIGHKELEDGTKVRYLLKTGEVIDDPKGDAEKRRKKDKSA